MDNQALRQSSAEDFFLLPDHAGIQYGAVLVALHRHFQPQSYLEIGTLSGESLAFANCPSIAIDPGFAINRNAMGDKPACLFMQMPSDRFFATYNPAALLNRPIDLAFLDGMHLFEFLLRDFINTERHCHPGSIVLMHDCLPTDAYIARRELGDSRFAQRSPHPDWWAGDVWKTVAILKQHRPDLKILALDAEPTGLIAITGLNPRSEVLSQRYFAVTEQYRSASLTQAGAEAFMRALGVRSTGVVENPPAFAELLGVRFKAPPAASPGPQLPAAPAAPAPEKPAEAPVAVHVFEPGGPPPAPLADLWPRLETILVAQRAFNSDEARVQAQQHGILRDGRFNMLSPFADEPQSCVQSYERDHRFWFRFAGREEFFWVSATLMNAFELSTLYFPQRRVAVTLREGDVSAERIADFETFRRDITKPSPPAIPAAGRRTVVSGEGHYMHVLWKELPALERAVAAGLTEKMQLAAVYQPFGPLAELFPELAGQVQPLVWNEAGALNAREHLLVGLGSLSITPGTRARLRRVGAAMAGADVLRTRDAFRAAHRPVVWVSVKPPKRTLRDQAAILARLMAAVKSEYPDAGFILNGASRPWDAESNPNFGGWFGERYKRATAAAGAIIDDVLANLPPDVRASVAVVTDRTACDEIAWGEAADFYFCHGGTMQHKIGYIHEVPGMIHCPNSFRDRYSEQHELVLDGPKCWFVPAGMVTDGGGETYATFNAPEVEPDYVFASPDLVVNEFLSALRTAIAPASVKAEPGAPEAAATPPRAGNPPRKRKK